jgi:hypothetical protein
MVRGWLCAGFVAVPALLAAQTRAVTFHEDVAPVLQKRCQTCHRPGEAAPFSMLTYKDARPWAASMKKAVVNRQMPPWHAEPGVGHFGNDRRLTQQEIDTIARWADGGAQEGDPKKAPAPLKFLEGWNIGQPDKVFEMPEPFNVPAEGTIEYQWIVMPTGLAKDTWIEGVEVRPGDRSVVHHVIAFYRRPGSSWLSGAKPGVPTPKATGDSEAGMSDGAIGGYVPGLPATRLPKGRAVLLPAGADIVLQTTTPPAKRQRTGRRSESSSRVRKWSSGPSSLAWDRSISSFRPAKRTTGWKQTSRSTPTSEWWASHHTCISGENRSSTGRCSRTARGRCCFGFRSTTSTGS